VDKFIELCANLIRKNCSNDVSELVGFALAFQRETFDLKREVGDLTIEITRLKKENQFLLTAIDEFQNPE
jgi:hypothetical protein